MSKFIRIALVFSLLFTTACATTQPSAPADDSPSSATAPAAAPATEAVEPDVIALNEVTHSVFYAPFYAAITQGFFADENIEIELTNGGGADKVMTAVLTGQSDIGLAGPEACIYVHTEGREDAPVVFAQLTKRDGSFLVGRAPEPDFTWDNVADTFIIGGRKGGIPLMTLEYVMKQHGIDPATDATVDTAIQFNMMAGAFSGGTGDYVALFEPTATMLELEGKGYVVASIGQDSGEIPYTAFFAAPSFLAENADLVQRFTDALYRGQQWVQTADATAIAQAVAPHFPDTDMAILVNVAQRYQDIDAWCADGVMQEQALRRLEEVMMTAGELDAPSDFQALVDNSFAENAIE